MSQANLESIFIRMHFIRTMKLRLSKKNKNQSRTKRKLGLCSVRNKNIYNKSREILFKNNVQ